MNREGMWKPALIGGLLLGILSALFSYLPPLNCCCCLWIIGGGTLASYIYISESDSIVTLGRGAALGAITGAIGTGVNILFGIPRYVLMKTPLAEQLSRALDETPNMPPEFKQMALSVLQQPGMLVFIVVIGIFISLIVNCLLAMLGGAIGVSLFEKRTPPAEPKNAYPEPPVSLPPPPPPTEPPASDGEPKE